tara:strand:+ start:114 stop:323 length:210 start_codon:yes stop_codon:yes gene_type:complete
MFGFSIGKILVLAVIVLSVLYGYKIITNSNLLKSKKNENSDTSSRIDTVYDPETDSYVTKDSLKKSKKT